MSEIDFSKVLCEQTVDLTDKRFQDKRDLFQYMAEMFQKAGYVSDTEEYIRSLYEREAMGSTYMENHLVLPHGKSEAVLKPGVAICRFEPMKYDEDLDELAEVAVMLAIPKITQQNEYVSLLAKISCSLMDEDVFKMILEETKKEVLISGIVRTIAE